MNLNFPPIHADLYIGLNTETRIEKNVMAQEKALHMWERMKQIRISSLKIVSDVQSDERIRFNMVARVQIWWSLDRKAPAESNQLSIFHYAKTNVNGESVHF